MIPAQAQRSLLDLALSELEQACRSVEVLLADAAQIWSTTLDNVQFRSHPTAIPCLNSVSTVLLEDLEGSQPRMEEVESSIDARHAFLEVASADLKRLCGLVRDLRTPMSVRGGSGALQTGEGGSRSKITGPA